MPKRKEEADCDRPPSFLHQLARDVVDCSDMIGVEGVAKAETVSERRRPQEKRKLMKGDDRPNPCGNIKSKQQNINSNDFASNIFPLIIKEIRKIDAHLTYSRLSRADQALDSFSIFRIRVQVSMAVIMLRAPLRMGFGAKRGRHKANLAVFDPALCDHGL